MLTHMSPGGRWMKPPHDGPAVYVPAKQTEAHIKRLVGENWLPCEDPRPTDGAPVQSAREMAAPMTTREMSMQAQIDQLTMLVQQSLSAQKEQHADGSSQHDERPDSESAPDDRRPAKRKPTV